MLHLADKYYLTDCAHVIESKFLCVFMRAHACGRCLDYFVRAPRACAYVNSRVSAHVLPCTNMALQQARVIECRIFVQLYRTLSGIDAFQTDDFLIS